jgi:hypothetical protein
MEEEQKHQTGKREDEGSGKSSEEMPRKQVSLEESAHFHVSNIGVEPFFSNEFPVRTGLLSQKCG